MELTVGQYGEILFEQMVASHSIIPHWESIRKEAEPLVRQLLALNDKMSSGGYAIVGYMDEKGKKKLSEAKRIEIAQHKLWSTKAKNLKKGDLIWTTSDSDLEMHIGDDNPIPVEFIAETYVVVEVTHCGGEHLEKVYFEENVLLAPVDFQNKRKNYESDGYWIEKADELGI